MGTPVRVYVYDVTRGMASQMAPMLLGRPLDGVWHTGIVVYGHEYFYGGGGIEYCPPSGTILGQPTQIADLGETEIPQDVFHDYLFELSANRFHGNAYHLLDHNCNTFSNEVAQFLTGQTIPDYVTNLPAEILATPFGQMIRPLIDSMMMDVFASGTVHIGPDAPPPLPVAPVPEPAVPTTVPITTEVRDQTSASSSSIPLSSQNAASAELTPKPTSSSDNKADDLDLD